MGLQICTSPACAWARLDSSFAAAVQSHVRKKLSRRAQASSEREISRTRLVYRSQRIAPIGIQVLGSCENSIFDGVKTCEVSHTPSVYRPGKSPRAVHRSWEVSDHVEFHTPDRNAAPGKSPRSVYRPWGMMRISIPLTGNDGNPVYRCWGMLKVRL